MENGSIKNTFEILSRGLVTMVPTLVSLNESIMDIARANNFDIDNHRFRHNWTMASYAKKKRTRKKYAKKCFK